MRSLPLAPSSGSVGMIALLQVLPDGHKHRGLHFPQRLLMVMAFPDIQSVFARTRVLAHFAPCLYLDFEAVPNQELPKKLAKSNLLNMFVWLQLELLFGSPYI